MHTGNVGICLLTIHSIYFDHIEDVIMSESRFSYICLINPTCYIKC